MEVKLDMTVFIAEAIISNKKLYKNIDNIYEKYKYEAYKAAKESEFYTHPIFTVGDIDTEIYGKRILGILLYARENESCLKNLYELIKIGWNQIVNYVEKTDLVNFDDLIELISNILKRRSNNFSDDEINGFITITLLAAQFNDKEVDLSHPLYQEYFSMIKLRSELYANKGSIRRFEQKNLSPDLKKKAITLKKRIIDKYGLPHDVRDLYHRWSEYRDFFDVWGLLFESEGIEYNFEQELDNKMVEELCALSFRYNNNLNVEEALKIFIPGVYMKVLLREYRKIKNYYFANHKETLYFDMKSKEDKIEELNSKISMLEREVRILKDRIKVLNEKDEKLEKENILLESENNKLKEFIGKMEKEKTELYELREYVFNSENIDIDMLHNQDQYIDLGRIKTLNAIFIGGTPKWRDQLKTIFIHSDFIPGEKINFDERVLANTSYVFFNVIGMSHAMYYKVRNICRSKGIKYYFLNKYDKDTIIKQINDLLDRQNS